MTPQEIRQRFIDAGAPLGFEETLGAGGRMRHDYDLQLRKQKGNGLVDFWVTFVGRGRLDDVFVVDEMLNRHDAAPGLAGGLALMEEWA